MKIYEVNPKPYLKLRIFATLIDYGIYLLVFCIYVFTVGIQTNGGSYTVSGLPALPLFLFWLLYFPGLEAINQATPGHEILKLKVIKYDGEKIGFTDAFKRRVCDLIDLGIWGLPAVICISKTAKHQRIGDILAGTVVVKKTDITEKELFFDQP